MSKFKFISLFLMLNAYIIHTVVVHHHHHSQMDFQSNDIGAIGNIGKGLAGGIGQILKEQDQKRATQKQFDTYVDIFENLGHNNAQSIIYAKMAMNDSNGFSGVVAHIERQNAARQELESQKALMRLKHQQDKEMLAYEKQLIQVKLAQEESRSRMMLILCIGFIVLIGFLGVGLFLYRQHIKSFNKVQKN